ncbi:hypothetical protein [Caudoviricetes sp.]|nr:hypothetical protein [Caudoviricetes sp.]
MGVSWLGYRAQQSGQNGLNGSRPTSPRHR